MVQFLSIILFSWISSIFVRFFKSFRFFVSPCISSHDNLYSKINNVFFHGIFYDDFNTSNTQASSVRVTGEKL